MRLNTHTPYTIHHHQCNAKTLVVSIALAAFAHFSRISLSQLGLYHFGSIWLLIRSFVAHVSFIQCRSLSFYSRCSLMILPCLRCAQTNKIILIFFWIRTSSVYVLCYMYCTCTYVPEAHWLLVTGNWQLIQNILFRILSCFCRPSIITFVSMNFSSMVECGMFGNFIGFLCVAMNRNSDWNNFSGHFRCFQYEGIRIFGWKLIQYHYDPTLYMNEEWLIRPNTLCVSVCIRCYIYVKREIEQFTLFWLMLITLNSRNINDLTSTVGMMMKFVDLASVWRPYSAINLFQNHFDCRMIQWNVWTPMDIASIRWLSVRCFTSNWIQTFRDKNTIIDP